MSRDLVTVTRIVKSLSAIEVSLITYNTKGQISGYDNQGWHVGDAGKVTEMVSLDGGR